MSIDDLKTQYIKSFETEGSYIHRDDLDEVIRVINVLVKDNQEIKDRLTALEAK